MSLLIQKRREDDEHLAKQNTRIVQKKTAVEPENPSTTVKKKRNRQFRRQRNMKKEVYGGERKELDYNARKAKRDFLVLRYYNFSTAALGIKTSWATICSEAA